MKLKFLIFLSAQVIFQRISPFCGRVFVRFEFRRFNSTLILRHANQHKTKIKIIDTIPNASEILFALLEGVD